MSDLEVTTGTTTNTALDADHLSDMALELTLVVAATRDMGIGLRGGLPWSLRKEMAYFARVTKRLPPGASPSQPEQSGARQNPALNAVIMGRKTWDSIPPKFRPLKGRLNVVISRSYAAAGPASENQLQDPADPDQEPVRAGSLEQAVAYLRARGYGHDGDEAAAAAAAAAPRGAGARVAGKVFVIGGAQIYGAAMQMAEARRVLLTRVESDVECDTFFPLMLGANGEAKHTSEGWRRASKAEHDTWVGEAVPEGVQEEGGIRYEFQMWERIDG